MIPSIQGDRVTTTFQFDGIYDFRGFLRFDREELAVIIRGAQLSTDNSEFYFDNGPIQMIQFSSFNGNTRNLRADILMNPVSNFSIVRSSESLMIQTPLTVERRNESAVLAIQEETQSSLDQGAVAATTLNTFQDSAQEDANDLIPDITNDTSLQEEPFIEEVPVVEEDQDIQWN